MYRYFRTRHICKIKEALLNLVGLSFRHIPVETRHALSLLPTPPHHHPHQKTYPPPTSPHFPQYIPQCVDRMHRFG